MNQVIRNFLWSDVVALPLPRNHYMPIPLVLV